MQPAAATDRWSLHDPDATRRDALDARVARWTERDVARRLWAKDPELWSPPDEATHGAIAERLGWLDLPTVSATPEHIAPLMALAEAARSAGVRHVLLLGMGGSSLAPEVYQRVLGAAEGSPTLKVLDSTHPAAVQATLDGVDPASTWFVVASKSGTTIETMSFFHAAWHRVSGASQEAGAHFIAITDPGTALAEIARERSFRATFLAPPDVGGRYSALAPFGLVPAALIGADVPGLLGRAGEMARDCGPEVAPAENPALLLGAALGELAAAGRDKLTILTSPGLASVPDWMEQLIAESLGKGGLGVVPVAGERPRPASEYAADRVFCQLLLAGEDPPLSQEGAARLAAAGHPVMRFVLRDRLDVAAEMMRWEMAVAAAGMVLGVQPFDQPNVELAKKLARAAMAAGAEGDGGGDGADDQAGSRREITVDTATAEVGARALADWLDAAETTDYVALMAFLAPTPAVSRSAEALRRAVIARGPQATTFGWGPRFLHSTGQMHKGGPPSIRAVQLVDRPADALPVPGQEHDFRQLIAAQAAGDLGALEEAGRATLRLRIESDTAVTLLALAEALAEA